MYKRSVNLDEFVKNLKSKNKTIKKFGYWGIGWKYLKIKMQECENPKKKHFI